MSRKKKSSPRRTRPTPKTLTGPALEAALHATIDEAQVRQPLTGARLLDQAQLSWPAC